MSINKRYLLYKTHYINGYKRFLTIICMCDIGNNFFLYESRKYKFSRVLIKIGKNTKVIYLNHSILPEKIVHLFRWIRFLRLRPRPSWDTQTLCEEDAKWYGSSRKGFTTILI